MKIKTLLVALVTGVALPLVALAGFITWQHRQDQQAAYAQQFLERASAVRLAIDTEFSVMQRTLRAVGDATEIPPPDIESVLLRRFRRVLDNYPHWLALVLTDERGETVLFETRPAAPAPPLLSGSAIRRMLNSNTGYVSDVHKTSEGQHVVFVATAVTRQDRTRGVIYAVIAHTHWLDLLREYPVSKRGTLTLIDRSATIVTRTLNDEKWSGARVPADFWSRTSNQAAGSFAVTGVDGTPLYAAFSRSKASEWILATGVPKDEVVQALLRETLMVAALALIAILGAMLAAWRLSHNIAKAFSGLMVSAEALASDAPVPGPALPISEAQTVQKALNDAHHELLARQLSLNGALEREGVARQLAESSSRSKDKFLAMMGHELRNPLSAISLAAELIPAQQADPAAGRSADIIKRQARHLTAMVNDLMDVAQLDAGTIVLHRKHLDLASVAAKVLLRFDETGRCAHLKARIAHEPAYIHADEARVELLITCLLDNACKYTPPGGDVTLEVAVDGDSSVLRVLDTGEGITAELAASMFEAFTQSERGIERTQGGLGLGLALARQLVELHGGEISATSEGPGRGAAFIVRFARVEGPQVASTSPNAMASRDTVFTVVEDIADTRSMLMEYIAGAGRRINGAADGPSGVETILAGPSDIAIVDLGLPGFSGLEVARRVRAKAQARRIYLVALTGFGTESDRTAALAAGFDEFLVKPFEPGVFEQAIDRGLAAVRSTG